MFRIKYQYRNLCGIYPNECRFKFTFSHKL